MVGKTKRCGTCANWKQYRKLRWGECHLLTVYDCLSRKPFRVETEDDDDCRGAHWKPRIKPKRRKR